MRESEILPHLFRIEYRKMVSVLCYQFGIEHIEIAEDIVSDTFLAATESWALSGNPENPTAWLYTVAKNKTRNHFKRSNLFESKLAPEIRHNTREAVDMELDFSVKNIKDSQLAMIFAICNPLISNESQIALALNVLCGFGVEEIANAFLTNREVIYKRLKRAKERLKEEHLIIEQPTFSEMLTRLDNVLTTIYLLFSEGYYSSSQHHVLRKDLCLEAMRLNYFLVENENTNTPTVNALLALMCFHSSRFEARRTLNGEMILYPDQDDNLWDQELIQQGLHFLNQSSRGKQLSKYHLEAGIAYWHTFKQDTTEKWERILQLYNQLIILDDSPVAALNRTYALYKAHGKREAIIEAEKLQLTNDHLYYSLLGTYTRKLTLTWR
jgi:RNA polymerase sigma factor (sigma-70 family)